MNKQALVDMMVELLQEVVDDQHEDEPLQATPALPLVGGEAVITSLGLVSFIADVELSLDEEYDLEVVLVSEKALSRQRSPFRTVDTLADYIVELVTENENPEAVAAD